MIRALTERKVKAGEYIIRQGESGDFFYIIDSGRFGVYVREQAPDGNSELFDGEEKVVLDGSGSFGELALMYGVVEEFWFMSRHFSVDPSVISRFALYEFLF